MDKTKDIVGSMKPLMWEIVSFLPRLVFAFIVLIVGWLLAKLIRHIIIKFLRLVRMDDAAEHIGVDSFLLQGGVRYTAVTLVAEIIYWFLIFCIMLFALKLLGMAEAGTVFLQVIYYVPKVLIAMVILLFGLLLARFIYAVMFAYLDNIGMQSAHVVSVIGQYAVVAFVIYLALQQLSIPADVLEDAFRIGLGALGLAVAIALGLGGKEIAKSLLGKAFNDKDKDCT